MRWQLAVTLGGGAAALVFACGGEPFTLESAADDATASDGAREGPPGSGDASQEAADGGRPDASAPDAPGSRDAMGDDAPLSLDAPGQVDAPQPPPHCSGRFACAPAVPAGWTGPFELYAGAGPSPACGANFSGTPLNGNAGLTAAAATCACGCGAAQGVQCSPPTLTFYGSSTTCATLGTSSCATATLTPGACARVDVTGPCGTVLGNVMTLPGSTPSQGSCTPLGTVGVSNVTWANRARACASSVALAQSDCPAASVCAPTPAAPFQTGVCIEQSGDVACPSTGYTTKSLYYGGVDDTRGCSTCSCGPVTGAMCNAGVDQFQSADGGCNTRQTTYLVGSCQPVQQPADLRLTLTASAGSCAPDASTPIGSAIPTAPMTFCCAP